MSEKKPKAAEGASSAPPGQDPHMRQGIIKSTQLAFPAVRDACMLILNKMNTDGVPYSADGISRAALGFVIAMYHSEGLTEEDFLKACKETWPWFEMKNPNDPTQDQNQGPSRLQS